MKYCIVTTCEESADYARLLVTEISRFDIRAEIFINSGNSMVERGDKVNFDSRFRGIKSNHFKANKYDLLAVIGDRFDSKLVASAKSTGVKTSFFQITPDHSSGLKTHASAIKKFDKVFTDFPMDHHSTSEAIGHYLNDLIRKYDFDNHETDQLKVGLLIGNKKIPEIIKLTESLTPVVGDCEWLIGLDSSMDQSGKSRLESVRNGRVLDQKLDVLKQSNAVIVDSEKDAVGAAFLNCPQIRIANKRSFFSFSTVRRTLINYVLSKELIKQIPLNQVNEIARALNLVLNDHEYCASIMTGYQAFKEKVGTQPVARNAAQKIIDWLEEE